jgi:hypothetical protein
MRQAVGPRLYYLVAVAIVGAGLLAVGCGDSSSGPLTKAEFVQEANSICRDADAERSEALQAADGDAELANLAIDAVAPVESMAEELGELSPPAGEAKEVRAIVAAFEAGVAEVKAEPADPTTAIAAFAEANELAEDSGLTDCVV